MAAMVRAWTASSGVLLSPRARRSEPRPAGRLLQCKAVTMVDQDAVSAKISYRFGAICAHQKEHLSKLQALVGRRSTRV